MNPHRTYFRVSEADKAAIEAAFAAGLRKKVIYSIAALHAAGRLRDDIIPAGFAAVKLADRTPTVTYIDRDIYYILRDAKRAARSAGRTPADIFACLHAGFLHAADVAKQVPLEA